jgi:ferredoxin
MTYVIAEPCVDVKNGACVEVCPVDCIHTTPEERQHYIDPDICIECEQCVLVCPVEAVVLDRDLPPEWEQYIEINAAFFQRAKGAAAPVSVQQALSMMRAAQAKATEVGAAVGVAVVDAGGRTIAKASMDGAQLDSANTAAARAAAAVSAYLEAGAELTTASVSVQLTSQPPGATARRRIAAQPGTMPVAEGVQIIGAIAVVGGSEDQDQQCSRAGLAAFH